MGTVVANSGFVEDRCSLLWPTGDDGTEDALQVA